MPAYPRPHAMVQQLFETAEDYVLQTYQIRDSPMLIRPVIVFALGAWVLILGVLGLAPLPDLPVNDKAMHFFGIGFASFLLYYVFEVPDEIWYYRRFPILFTLVVGSFCGSILTEMFQSLLPWREFQFGDIVANLFGSLCFLYLAYFLDTRRLRRAEISELYTPLHAGSYRDAQGRTHAFSAAHEAAPASSFPASGGGGGGAGAAAVGAAAAGAAVGTAVGLGGEWAEPPRNDVWDDELTDGEFQPSTNVFALDDDDDDGHGDTLV